MIVRENGRSSTSCRASVAVTPICGRSGGSRWSTVGHRRVSTPVKAAHHPSSWCRFVGSGLLVHRFEVCRRDRKDSVFACERCTRRRTGRYDAEFLRWTQSRIYAGLIKRKQTNRDKQTDRQTDRQRDRLITVTI